MGTAVAAISAILTDFAAGMCAWNLCSSAPCLGTGVRFLLIACLRCEQFQVFRLPEHRVVDPIPAAGVVEEDPLFEWTGVHLAILAEMNGGLREPVRLPAGVQAVHVGFVFVRADVRVEEWRVYEGKERTQKEDQGKHRGIPNSAHLPAFSPASQGPFE